MAQNINNLVDVCMGPSDMGMAGDNNVAMDIEEDAHMQSSTMMI